MIDRLLERAEQTECASAEHHCECGNDDSLALRELRFDPAFHLISCDARAAYPARSLAIGRDAAAPYLGCDPAELAIELGARIVLNDLQLEIAGHIVRSEYDAGTHAITIHTRSIAEIAERQKWSPCLRDLLSLSRTGRCGLDPIADAPGAGAVPAPAMNKAIVDIHIAHELFHHLEETRIGRTDERLPSVALRRLGPFEIGSTRIRRCREIAAHAFAKTLLGLPCLPNAIDLCRHGRHLNPINPRMGAIHCRTPQSN